METVAEWLVLVVKGLVSHPDDVSVEHSADFKGVLFTLHMNPEDAGKLIGRDGTTAGMLRQLLRQKGYMHDVRAALKLDVPDLRPA